MDHVHYTCESKLKHNKDCLVQALKFIPTSDCGAALLLDFISDRGAGCQRCSFQAASELRLGLRWRLGAWHSSVSLHGVALGCGCLRLGIASWSVLLHIRALVHIQSYHTHIVGRVLQQHSWF